MKRLAIGAAVIMATIVAHAETPANKPNGAANAAAQKPKDPRPVKPAPNVRLSIETPATRGPWTMRVTNDGDVPVRIVADARLLSLDVTPRGARKATHCDLPADMRLNDDLERSLVVPPGGSYAESFEPRLYCFGGKLDALDPGAVVVARLGWPSRSRTDPPFETSPIEGIEPEVAPLKSIESLPVALPDEPSPGLLSEEELRGRFDPDLPRLSLRASEYIDADSPNDIEVGLTIRNDGTRAAVVRFRPDVLAFDIVGPNGPEHCVWPMIPAAAMLEMFSTLAPKATETLHVTLDSYCTDHGLDLNGLIVVMARLDTRKASGAPLGLPSFDGELVAKTPTVVRLHRGAAPHPPPRPRLEETHP
jgi:hypothetical protein